MSRGEEVIDNFTQFSRFLDARHDKHEAIYKLSRDITVDSKRVIFSIHRLLDQKDKAAGLAKIHSNFADIGKLWLKMNNLLKTEQDPYLFRRAFTPGMQEFIEALTFLSLIESSELPSCDQIIEKTASPLTKEVLFVDILLGIADIAGEVMRFVTNMVSKGVEDYNVPARGLLRNLYLNYLSIPPDVNREMGRKISALKGSMMKVEFICYMASMKSLERTAFSA